MGIRYRWIALAVGLAATWPALAQMQTVPNVVGTYVGTLTDVDTLCNNSADNGTSQFTATLNITKQVGNNIDGNGTTNDGDSFTFTNGSVNQSSSITFIQFTFSGSNSIDGTTFSGFFSADLINNSLSLGTVSGSGSDGCNFALSGTLARSSGNAVGPDAPGIVGTTVTDLRTQVLAYSGQIGTRVQDALRGTLAGPRRVAGGFMLEGTTGRAAGEGFDALGVWGSYSRSEFDNSFAATAFDGHRNNFLFGADISPLDSVVVGLAFGYEDSNTTTTFNAGEAGTNGWTLAPYAGVVFGDNWSLDASVGYSNVNTDQFRTAAGTRVSSSVDGQRFFVSTNLTGTYTFDQLTLSPSAGWTLARSFQDSFTETDGSSHGNRVSRIEQWRIGGEAAYGWKDFEPFARATYEHDYSFTKIKVATGTQPANDNDDVLFAAGVRYFSPTSGLTGAFEWNRRLSRSQFGEDLFNFTLRMDF